MATILVTGGSGDLRSKLVEHFLSRGETVRVLSWNVRSGSRTAVIDCAPIPAILTKVAPRGRLFRPRPRLWRGPVGALRRVEAAVGQAVCSAWVGGPHPPFGSGGVDRG